MPYYTYSMKSSLIENSGCNSREESVSYSNSNRDTLTRDSVIMVAAGVISGIFTYIYQLIMGIFLEPAEYGIFLSLTSLFVIFAFVTQFIILTTAKATSGFIVKEQLGAVNFLWRSILWRYMLYGLVLFLILCATSPFLIDFLKIDNYLYPILVFSTFIITFSLAGNWGILQGLQRFVSLGINQIIWGFLRPMIAVILILLGFGLSGGIAALPLSFLSAFLCTFLPLRSLNRFEQEKVELRHM